ncbi:hypothetical protein BV25DRAFT_1921432 [Artomyces pyxidatus]|uniref:Uncharacterized protein n=1 Tax=Artomyces pyxidatus TaxID=48021 RepID=A0ACB8SHG4_9AGAM|nr:hypothetical protein BV25DRAFT_1921432 [Artomyces pyxidatus]
MLHEEWPCLLGRWDSLQALVKGLERPYLSRVGGYDVSALYPDPAVAIRIATEYELPEVLPIPVYDLLRVTEMGMPLPAPEAYREAKLSALTADDFHKLTRGRAELRVHVLDVLDSYTCVPPSCGVCFEPPDEDVNPDAPEDTACQKAFREWFGEAAKRGLCAPDPIAWFLSASSQCEFLSACPGCKEWARKNFQSIREDLWSRLPVLVW